MEGMYYIRIASNHLEEMKKRINEKNFEDFHKEIQEVSSAMFYLLDWVNAQQDKPR